MNKPREFWIRSENLIYACYDTKQQNSIHVIERSYATDLEQQIQDLKLQLADRSEKYKLFIESGLDRICGDLKAEKAKSAKLIEALKKFYFNTHNGLDQLHQALENGKKIIKFYEGSKK